MFLSHPSSSFHLTFAETTSRLCASDQVVGIALFGSRVHQSNNPLSDYDLLILFTHVPVEIFQMFTHIEGRLADVVFADLQTAGELIRGNVPILPSSKEWMLLQKMLTAKIIYDPSGQLAQTQKIAKERQRAGMGVLPPSESERYAAWFWQNHSLAHIERMFQSGDPVYLTAVDLMLTSGISRLCRDYYRARGLVWEGEKAAVRFLQDHDPRYLNLLRCYLAESGRAEKVNFYRQLVEKTIAPIGPIWIRGQSAVYLRNMEEQPARVEEALAFWEELIETTAR